jgi:peptide deformylase
MVLPIFAYGAPVLRTVAKDISPDFPGLAQFMEDMWETMHYSNGVGLAAPQVGKDIRLFLVDSGQVFINMEEGERGKYPDEPGIRQVFINAHIHELSGPEWPYNEGCLSIPKIREDIIRRQQVRMTYLDEKFQPHTDLFTGITARIVLHEYDHIEGKLFIDYLKPLKRKLLKGKLDDISKGKINVDYKMVFPR